MSNNVFIEKKNKLVADKEGDLPVYRKLTDKPSGEVSIEKLRKIQKKLPPDGKDNVSQAEIDQFNNFGKVGWHYFQEEMFKEKGNKNLEDYVKYSANHSEL